jgi:peptidoglycan-N-acetylglucosamine deacetylase
MDTPSVADEGDPAKQSRFITLFSFSLFTVVLVTACNERKTSAEQSSVVDTVQITRQIPKNKADTAPKTATKKIYITFDDGPNRGTRNVLKTIKEENIPVSFFIVGKHVFDSPSQTATWEEMEKDSTIELCNHSYSHARNKYTSFYNNPEGVVNDFKQCQEKLHFTNTITRMPGRNSWRIDSINITDLRKSKKAIDAVHQAGFDIMGWDIEWSFDHKTFLPDQDTATLFRKIFNQLDAGTSYTPGHLVLLAHDQAFQREENLAILRLFLRSLKQNPDYDFALVSTYPGIKKSLP